MLTLARGRVGRCPPASAAAALTVLAFLAATPATAAPVLVLREGHVRTRDERFLGPSELSPAGPRGPEHARTGRAAPTHDRPGARGRAGARGQARARGQAGAQARAGAPGPGRRAPRRRSPPAPRPTGAPTHQALDQLLAAGQIDQSTHDDHVASLNRALSAYGTLHGTRQTELGAVIENADSIATAGQLTPSRLGAVFATLDANTQWWASGPLLSQGQRVSVGSSPLVWEYYPGQGIELQMLGNFSKANGLWDSGSNGALRNLLGQLVPLAADRGGWPAWEYYFRFDGGMPPWTSSISQGTAVQALARAGQRLHDPSLTSLGQRALTAFLTPPPAGVRYDTGTGPFYLIYSFTTAQQVINAHLQAVIGLHDFWQITGDQTAQTLFQQGDTEAQAVLPRYDTGHWSLYDQTTESDLSYHQLVIGFLQNLCQRTSAPIYCDTAARFRQYLTQPPTVTAVTTKIRSGAPARLSFSLDKISRVGIAVSKPDGSTAFSTSGTVGRGQHYFTWPSPGAPGSYQLRLRATDLAGNQSKPATAALQITPARKHAGRRRVRR